MDYKKKGLFYGDENKHNCGCDEIQELCYPKVRLRDYKNIDRNTSIISFSAYKLCPKVPISMIGKCSYLIAKPRGLCDELFNIVPYKADNEGNIYFDFQDYLKNSEYEKLEFEINFNGKCKVYYGINLIECGLHDLEFNVIDQVKDNDCENLEIDQDYIENDVEGCNDC